MEKEFNLSEKKTYIEEWVYPEKDVKEFIKEVKKIVYGKDGFHLERIHKKINKLAGEELQ